MLLVHHREKGLDALALDGKLEKADPTASTGIEAGNPEELYRGWGKLVRSRALLVVLGRIVEDGPFLAVHGAFDDVLVGLVGPFPYDLHTGDLLLLGELDLVPLGAGAIGGAPARILIPVDGMPYIILLTALLTAGGGLHEGCAFGGFGGVELRGGGRLLRLGDIALYEGDLMFAFEGFTKVCVVQLAT